jgi:uncharacterized protein (UPF0332 family)
VITDLPEQLIAKAEFLIRDTEISEANVRRAVSAAYYALFHLLVREASLNWKHPDHRSELARAFDHRRIPEGGDPDPQRVVHFKLSTVAQAFVD